jgi:fibro-slime domain-containing protein
MGCSKLDIRETRSMKIWYAPLAGALMVIACSSGDPGTVGAGGGNGGGQSGGGGLNFKLDGSAGHGGSTGATTAGPGQLLMLVRDFKFYAANDSTTDPDFENVPKDVDGSGNPSPGYVGNWDDHNIVTDKLGEDFKPVYKNASGKTLTTHGKDAFDKWFRTVDKTNIAQEIPITLTDNGNGTFSYDSKTAGPPLSPNGMFFPIDNGGDHATKFGNQGTDDNGVSHNFSFTVEIHTVFTYQGGETFHFSGDDDVFVYIDKKLVINLGGIHGREAADVSLDSLGLTVGNNYPLDFFYAERHVTQSNLLITTTLALSNNPDIPIF